MLIENRRPYEELSPSIDMRTDTGVVRISNCLLDHKVLLAVSGGIAAVESVKLARELRRHGASVTAIMSKSAEKVISPLAISWGSSSEVLTEWSPEMSQLGSFDCVILAPATRNTISKHIHGIIDSPLMMALSVSRGNGTPMLFVPSMHDDLFHDPVTKELLGSLESSGASVFTEDSSEGRKKQPDAISIVAIASNLVNSSMDGRRRVAITLGSNRARIDSIRAIQNTSTGATGWGIAEHLFRMGHDVICVAGETSASPSFPLPKTVEDSDPDVMLANCIDLAKSETPPEVWIHAAAVLDYIPDSEEGKRSSEAGEWELRLSPGKKHIGELTGIAGDSYRIAFKLGVGNSAEGLIESSNQLIERYGVNAVIANTLDEDGASTASGHVLVLPDGSSKALDDTISLCEAIEGLISS